MKPRLAMGVVLALALAACSKPAAPEGGDANAPSAAKTGAPRAAANTIRPGQWRTVTTVTDVSMANAPPAMVAQMKGHPTTEESCVTSEDISQFANPPREDRQQNCTQLSMTSAGGRIAGDSSCQYEGGSSTMHITGTYDADHVVMNMQIAMTTSMGQMTQTVNVASQRIGECTPGAQ